MAEGDHGDMVGEFMQITGLSDETTCRGLLEAFNWDVENAASAYFDDAHGVTQSPTAARVAAESAAPMGVHRPPERLVDPMGMSNESDEGDENFSMPMAGLGRRDSSVGGARPIDIGGDDGDDDDDEVDVMRSTLFSGGFPAGMSTASLAARAAAAAATAANGRGGSLPSARPYDGDAVGGGADGLPSDEEQLQRVLAESAQDSWLARAAAAADRAVGDAPDVAHQLEHALATSQQAFSREEERLFARAVAMSKQVAARGGGTEDDPLDLDDEHDPALLAAMEASVQPGDGGGERAFRELHGGSGSEPPGAGAHNPIDADAELAASLAGGDDDEDGFAQHFAHPGGPEASYAQAARRAASVLQPASARELLLREQQREYDASLALDRARDESVAAEDARARAEAASAEAAARALAEAAEAAQRQGEARLAAERARLTAEPLAGADGVVTVAVRLPEGGRIMRRFEKAQSVSLLYDWVHVAWADLSGLAAVPPRFTVVSHMPRKAHDDRSATLAESGLSDRQCALFVEPHE